MMHQSEFDAANVALSRAADKRKSLINIHKNRYTATLNSQAMLFIVDKFHNNTLSHVLRCMCQYAEAQLELDSIQVSRA